MNNPQINIRCATPEDAELVLGLLRELAQHENSLEHASVTLQQWRDYLQRDDVIVLIAETTGTAIGYVSAIRRTHLWTGGDIIALDDLYVQEHRRNGGIGALLMTHLATRAAEAKLTIRWEVNENNAAGQRFYTRLGARLRTKVIASWTPEQYEALLTPRSPAQDAQAPAL